MCGARVIRILCRFVGLDTIIKSYFVAIVLGFNVVVVFPIEMSSNLVGDFKYECRMRLYGIG